MKKPTDHFSLTALRKSINEHEHPLFTLTKSEMEGLVGRLEKARDLLKLSAIFVGANHGWSAAADAWLRSLEHES